MRPAKEFRAAGEAFTKQKGLKLRKMIVRWRSILTELPQNTVWRKSFIKAAPQWK